MIIGDVTQSETLSDVVNGIDAVLFTLGRWRMVFVLHRARFERRRNHAERGLALDLIGGRDSSCRHTKRPEFFAARFAEVAKNVDGVLVDHLA